MASLMDQRFSDYPDPSLLLDRVTDSLGDCPDDDSRSLYAYPDPSLVLERANYSMSLRLAEPKALARAATA